MDFMVNDLSFHGQFQDIPSFRLAIERLMVIRQVVSRFDGALYCHRNLAQAQVTSTAAMRQAVGAMPLNEQRALMQWLTRHGPFWDDTRNHGADDWLECNGEIVTDTAVGEAGWCCLNGIERALVSLTPSNWEFSPVPVDWVSDASSSKTAEVENYWDPAVVEPALQRAPAPLDSWEQLQALATVRCGELTFAADAFAPLNGVPFGASAAHRILALLDTLNRLKSCFDEAGKRTPEGHEIYQNSFTGKKGEGGHGALFSDASDDEKVRFEAEMTFRHPADPSRVLFCPWHGRVQTPQLRVHFSWPVRSDEPLYVVYVGPKRTKR